MDGLPPQLFKITLNSACDRLNVTNSLTAWLEEFSEIEGTIGRSLFKTVSQSNARVPDGMPYLTTSFDEITKVSMGNMGRKHMDFATNVTQHISKTFPETTKTQRKRLQLIFARISGIQENLKKNKAHQQRLYEKYSKLIKDTEYTVKESANATSVNPQTSVDGADESVLAAGGVKGSITKMFNKIAPEKKLQDKFRDMIKEIENMEQQLVENAKKTNSLRQELLAEIKKVYSKDWFELERNRLQMLKDGMSRIIYSVYRLKEKGDPGQTAALTGAPSGASRTVFSDETADAEFQALLKRVDTTIFSSDVPNALQFVHHFDVDNAGLKLQVQLCSMYMKIEKFAEAMEILAGISSKSMQILSEIADHKRQYVGSLQRNFEKHGLHKVPSEEKIYANAVATVPITNCSNSLSSSGLNNFPLASSMSSSTAYGQLVQQYELPAVKQFFESTAVVIGAIEELTTRSSDTYISEVVSSLDMVFRRISASKRDMLDKTLATVKKVENIYTQGKTVHAKLIKLRALIKERKSTLRAAKGGQPTNELDGNENNDDEDSVTTTATESTTSSAAPAATNRNLKVKFQALGSSIRAGMNLKQAVGLENTADRIVRIENQIQGLEEEERQLTDQYNSILLQANKTLEESINESQVTYSGMIELMNNDFKTMKRACSTAQSWQNEYRENLSQYYDKLRNIYDRYNIESDINFCIQLHVTAAGVYATASASLEAGGALFEIPPEDVFIPVTSDIIAEQKLDLFPTRMASLTGEADADGEFVSTPLSPTITNKKTIGAGALIPPASPVITPVAASATAPTSPTRIPSVSAPVVDLMNEDLVPSTDGFTLPSVQVAPETSSTEKTQIIGGEAQQKLDEPSNNASSIIVDNDTTVSPKVVQALQAEVAVAADTGVISLSSHAATVVVDALKLEANNVPSVPPQTTTATTEAQNQGAVTPPLLSSPVASTEKKVIPTFSPPPSTPSTPVRDRAISGAEASPIASLTTAPSIKTVSNIPIVVASTVVPPLPMETSEVNHTVASAIVTALPEVKEDTTTPKPPVEVPAQAVVKTDISEMNHEEDNGVVTPRKDSGDSTLRVDMSSISGNDVSSKLTPPGPSQTSATPAAQKREQDNNELRKFGLSMNDKVLESFSCALYPKNIPSQGRMFITQHYVAFSSWGDLRVLLSLRRIEKVNKATTLGYIPNAISIVMENKEEFFFGSFMDRELCYTLLTNLMQIEKRILQLHRDDADDDDYDDFLDDSHLEFGYQSRGIFKAPAANAPAAGPGAGSFTDILEGGETISSPSSSGRKVFDEQGGSEDSEKATSDETIKTESARVKEEKAKPIVEDDSGSFQLDKYFDNAKIIPIADDNFQVGATELWRACWQQASSFKDYLTSEGDTEIEMTEWTPLAAGKNTPPEDASKLTFHYSRICNYAHKRTTMLMFGPPIAPTRQIQYLHIPNHTPTGNTDILATIKPSKFVVMFVTQFEGIPFSDAFKVATYYTVETKSTSADHANKTAFYRVGVNLHFIKSTMFKSNIITGTKDEMIPAVKTYYEFVKDQMLPAINDETETAEEEEAAPEEEEEAASTEEVDLKPIVEDDSGSFQLDKYFDRAKIISIADDNFQVGATELWQACWHQASSFKDYLTSEGDTEIEMTEWTPLAAGKNTPPEDASKLTFHYSRICNYAHKRTTMLMFGPPIAPTRQIQYLHIPNHTPTGSADVLASIKPSKFVVMFVTQFEGIPFSDAFKVATYYTVETKSTSADNANKTAFFRVGINIHFIKSTMFKSNIITGTKDEMIPAVKTFYGFVKDQMLPARVERLSGKKVKVPAKATKKSVAKGTVVTDGSGNVASATETTDTTKAARRMSKRMSVHDTAKVHQWTEIGYWLNLMESMKADSSYILIIVILFVIVLWQWWSMRGVRSQLHNVQDSLESMKATLNAIQQSLQTLTAESAAKTL